MSGTTERASRRALLAGAAAGAAILATEALARPLEARAANGDALILGQDNQADGATQLHVGSGTGLRVAANGAGETGVIGQGSGFGMVADGDGVGLMAQSHGDGSFPRAVIGHAFNRANGIHGMSLEAETFGEYGPGFGLMGESRLTAITGHTYGSPSGDPVWDEVVGVRGVSQTTTDTNGPGVGVMGSTGSGVGVVGMAHTSGIGVVAIAESGLALQARGDAEFWGSVSFGGAAGRGTIAAGASRATVTTGVRRSEAPQILVTLLGDPRGKRPSAFSHVEIGEPNGNGTWTFDVVLSGAAGRATPFAYLVMGF